MTPLDDNIKPSKDTVDYALILTSAVHDMKNSLCLLLQSIESMSADIKASQDDRKHGAKLADLHYEVLRLNSSLIQVLSLYRDEKDQLPLNIAECFIADYFNEFCIKNQMYSDSNNIEISINIDIDLAWYCDHNLINYLLSDVFINALRYSKGKILVTANIVNKKLVIEIADNGDGYPDSMLQAQHSAMGELSCKQGRTGLGLYFARLIANAHIIKGEVGHIELKNGGSLGGGIFTLTLP
ncbi:sensor histidine kinase [Moritella viscosa]|uniref:Signal transduction histidine kinase n=1 Tax=Moritella viscosa TaxID=80854 RepID=A0A090IGH9_9GAMM|nr:HAMP domain-containing sensor histidine kinase [Moritella viscosa]CED61346.1 sensor protein, histidine kinase [Moritella viscosa]SGY88614.1 Signal transduction histidine kinase [Moritella viscosa]SGY92075.1 Signal transduction histidine kinase [Moritella viscosa]SGY92084.1 Signal transduction histidine kinase [Moritella viscosa]SGY95702.1 Signal transduction histidine kinase [Moritella viscosa]